MKNELLEPAKKLIEVITPEEIEVIENLYLTLEDFHKKTNNYYVTLELLENELKRYNNKFLTDLNALMQDVLGLKERSIEEGVDQRDLERIKGKLNKAELSLKKTVSPNVLEQLDFFLNILIKIRSIFYIPKKDIIENLTSREEAFNFRSKIAKQGSLKKEIFEVMSLLAKTEPGDDPEDALERVVSKTLETQ